MAALPVEPVPVPSPLLELERVDAGYAAFRALFGVTLAVPEGSALALLGSNGGGDYETRAGDEACPDPGHAILP